MTRIAIRNSLAVALAVAVAVAASGCGSSDSSSQATKPKNRTIQVPLAAGDPHATKKPQGQAALDALGPVRRPHSAPNIASLEGLTGVAFITKVYNEVASFWTGQFNRNGQQLPPTTIVIVDKAEQTGCGPIDQNLQNAFYCTGDQKIWLPVNFLKGMRQKDDAVPAIIVAHEFGHRIQDVLGIFPKAQFTKQTELQADCLAGVWMASEFRTNDLEPGDVDAAVAAFQQAGDLPGTPAEQQNAHGQGSERRAAFSTGYSTGDAKNCSLGVGSGAT